VTQYVSQKRCKTDCSCNTFNRCNCIFRDIGPWEFSGIRATITYDLLLEFRSNYVPILHCFRYTAKYWSKIANFMHVYLAPHRGCNTESVKNWVSVLASKRWLFHNGFSRLNIMHTQMYGRREGRTPQYAYALHMRLAVKKISNSLSMIISCAGTRWLCTSHTPTV